MAPGAAHSCLSAAHGRHFHPSTELTEMKIRSFAFGLLLAAAAPVFAADIDGKWTGTVDSPNGPVTINYTFKSAGEGLTGSTTDPMGKEWPIANGKITGNKVSFSLTLDFGQGPATFNYTGEVSATDLKLHSDFMGNPFDLTLKKAP
jgi:hypothetical protein